MTTSVTIWNKLISTEKLVIAGPCSAETEHQVLDTAQRLANTGQVDMLRAGIWKPRTKPGSFEGNGAKALPWLEKARQKTGLPFIIEVAKAQHVKDALKHQPDMLWIGARTTTNPFSVQEIADALKGTDIPVLVKNPICPDLQLWIGAIQRLKNAGISKIGAIHRGFSNYGNTLFRNAPMWHIPLELKRLHPEIPIICDPSHICGRRDTLQTVSQHALSLKLNGLMIESHHTPNDAWSDAKQQITPEQLDQLLTQLVSPSNSSTLAPDKLAKSREQIDQLDDEVLMLLASRMKIAKNIGEYKKTHHMRPLQAERWNEVLHKAILKGEKIGLTKLFIEQLLNAIHQESITHQREIISALRS